MYGYIRQGRRTALTRETIGGVPFWVLTAGQGRLRRRGVRRLLRRMARCGVKTAVFEDDAWQAAAAKYGIRPPPVQALRLCKLGELLDCVCPRGLRGQAVRLHTGEDGAAARRAARQQVTYAAPGLGPWPVTEQLLAALTAAEQWEPSEIHVVSVTSRA